MSCKFRIKLSISQILTLILFLFAVFFIITLGIIHSPLRLVDWAFNIVMGSMLTISTTIFLILEREMPPEVFKQIVKQELELILERERRLND